MNNTNAPHTNGQPYGSLAKPDRLNLHEVWRVVEQVHDDLQLSKPQVQKGHDAPLLQILEAILAGCSTPILCLIFSTLTGVTAAGLVGTSLWWLPLLPAGIVVCMLVVSTPHIAEAKMKIAWKPWQAWAFAVGLDLAVTVAETLNIFAYQALAKHNLSWLPLTTIAGAVVYSAWQNSYVNLIHVKWSWVIDPRDDT